MLNWLNTNPEDKSQGAFKAYWDGMASEEKKVHLFLFWRSMLLTSNATEIHGDGEEGGKSAHLLYFTLHSRDTFSYCRRPTSTTTAKVSGVGLNIYFMH